MASRHASDPAPLDPDEVDIASPAAARPIATSTSSAISSSRKSGLSLRNFSFSRRSTAATGNSSEDGWGPTGLNLLHSPPDPLLDLVFVHGLRGGSIKTWCKNNDPQLYWPKAWLPKDPDLQNVRIHSFGYNSDWGESKETELDLHDFGRSLLAELTTSPELRKGDKTPIIVIGHSMGGLVMKKAYILARQDDRYHEVANRIQCMFFLASPHRGSDSAKLLNSVLRASPFLNPKQYISDIARNSGVLSIINDEFRLVSEDLQIWSFYETIKTRMGTNSVLIVDRESAIIGHRRENVNPINADHRGICKFDSPSDPNYISIRNSLVKATEDLLGDVFRRRPNESRYQANMLEAYLNISRHPIDDLNTIEAEKSQGSCEWITRLSGFQEWRDAERLPLLCHWLSGQAGAGKSVLAAHLVRHLQEHGFDTCYFFFRHGQMAKQTTSSLLRSLAFQMASLHPSILKVLFGMRESGMVFDKDDEKGIWRKIFNNGVLTVPLATKQYWVIDGLDECVDPTKLLSLLHSFESRFPIRIHFTSRRLADLEKHLGRLNDRLLRHHMEVDDTLQDIQQFIQDNSDDLPVDPEFRPGLVQKLLQKSDGVFLWIKLAFEELGKVFSEDEIDDVLELVPVGMTPMYNRILDSMTDNSGRQLKLMKAIVEWAVCGTRPLHTDELQAALTIHMKANIRNVGRIVKELCGQLFKIDDRGLVQVLHATAREFLLSEECNPVFRLDRTAAHERLAVVCLTYLTSDEMRPPRHPAMLGKGAERSCFADYACTSFSEHLVSASSTCVEMTMLLDKFLRTNVLSWIEFILKRKRDPYYLSNAAKNLRKYLDKRPTYPSSLDQQYCNMEMWQIDILRVTSKFGENLIKDPACIYFVVPPLCPSQTAIRQQFANTPSSLKLGGLANATWDDCVAYIDHRHSRALSIAGGDDIFAIGMKSGTVNIHHQTTCQEIRWLHHHEPVRLLRFDESSQHIASSGYRYLKMWSTDGEFLWAVKSASPLVTMDFSEKDGTLLTVDIHGKVNALDIKTGIMSSPSSGDEAANKQSPGHGSKQIILDADISPDGELLAVGYRGRPPQIWSIEQRVVIGTCHMTRDKPDVPIMSISQVLFSPNPVLGLLAVAYQDGELAIFKQWTGGHEIKAVVADALTLAASPDGRTLATADGNGTIKLWDFQTLTLLYCIRSSEFEVRRLAFSLDGCRLYDIRDTKTKVWEPAVLGGTAWTIDRDGEEPSMSKSIVAPIPVPSIVKAKDARVVDITCIIAPSSAGAILVGKDDGSVFAYDPTTGNAVTKLYSHSRDMFVRLLSCNDSLIASTDASGRLLVYALTKSASQEWVPGEKVFEASGEESPFHHLLLHPTKPWLLVSQGVSTRIFDLANSAELALHANFNDDRKYESWVWLKRDLGQETMLMGVCGHMADIYLLDFSYEAGTHQILLCAVLRLVGLEMVKYGWMIERITTDRGENYLAVELGKNNEVGRSRSSFVAIYSLKSIRKDTAEKMDTSKSFLAEAHKLTAWPIIVLRHNITRNLFGFHGSDTIVFLDHDLWVRSINLSNVKRRPEETTIGLTEDAASYAMIDGQENLESLTDRHFFVPREYIGSNNDVDGLVTPDHGTVVFPKEGELAVVSNGLNWSFTGSEVDY
ncbi:WD40-repeat-containing domain protein [Rhypophila decipiens]|uniref:WD40-repeat-containing domain protein n=1 Tax=Rhypophila decipiens TaxID=261697 RepID=A0AAN6Y8A8_9PEZI|nr:WD40-repeat-containing domain protein [Rhypophila decipiens]